MSWRDSRIARYLVPYRDDAETWSEGRSAMLRIPLLVYLGYAGVRHLVDPMYRSWFGGITLVFHEMGHLLFMWFGNTMMLLGGSIMQLVVPAAAAGYLLVKQRDYFGFAVGGAWLSFSMWELALYVWDAARESLPLVGFGDHPQHDWGTLLTNWHLLNHCDTFAFLLRVLALATWAASMALGAWLCWRMLKPAAR
jgi:hypothetical protein